MMNDNGYVKRAKVVSIASFLVLLSATYFLRSEVLTLNAIRFSADEIRAKYELKELRENHPFEVQHYKVALKNHELATEHYHKMLNLYQTDYNTYMARNARAHQPPQLPDRPRPPRPPEFKETLSQINADFRARKHHYFQITSLLNWVACAAALGLVGGLLVLIFFDANGNRLIYFATLVLSFGFMIGPSFHSIVSAIVGFLEAPRVY